MYFLIKGMDQEIIAEKIMVDRYYHRDSRKKANEIVHDFIVAKQLIITGGLVIDFALRLKGEKIYEDFAVPDYDFFSADNAHDACELFEILRSSGLTDISLLPGIHPSTIKIFVYKDCIADITFAYKSLFEDMKKSALIYNNMMFRNPLIQYVDMHRALSYPYENEPRETINNRWVKDFERFCRLYKHYSVDYSDKRVDMSRAFTFKGGDIKSQLNLSELDFSYVVAGKHAIEYYLSKYDCMPQQRLDDSITYLMDDTDVKKFMIKHGKAIKDVKQYKPYGEIMPERTEMTIGDMKYVILHCSNKTGVYNIEDQQTAIKQTIKNAYLRVAKAENQEANQIANSRIVCVNFCIMYCFAMYRINKNSELGKTYWLYYSSLLDLVYKAYTEGIVDLYPAVTIYGEEKDNPIIAYASEHPEAKVGQVHISSDNTNDENEDNLAKLPWDFKYEKSVYVLDGSLIEQKN